MVCKTDNAVKGLMFGKCLPKKMFSHNCVRYTLGCTEWVYMLQE